MLKEHEKYKIEREMCKVMATGAVPRLFAGLGIAAMLDHMIRVRRLTLTLSGEPIRRKSGQVVGTSYKAALHAGYELRGLMEAEDFFESLVMAAANSVGIVGQAKVRANTPGSAHGYTCGVWFQEPCDCTFGKEATE